MRKLSNRVLSCLLCLICVFALFSVQVFAADAIHPNQDVHLTIEYTHEKTPVVDVPFDLYYVASVNPYAEFTLTGDFRQYPVVLDNLTAEMWKDLAETLALYAERDQLKPLDSGVTDSKGVLSFPAKEGALKPGLYLVTARNHAMGGYTYITEPFLLALPNLDPENNVWDYDVTAAPKHTRFENPPSVSNRTVTRKVLKVWKGDVRETRPKEVVIQLLKDGSVYDTVTLSAANYWRHTWKRLPAYNDDGSKIDWGVTETPLENYTVLIANDGVTFTVTNTYSPKESSAQTVNRTVLKVWDDKGYESRRPKSVQATLLQNGTVYDTRTLNDANGWQYTWNDLPKHDANGNEIRWTVQEAAVPGYISRVRENSGTFVLTNTLDKQKLPQTGVLWWPVPIFAVAGLVFLIAGILSRKKKGHE